MYQKAESTQIHLHLCICTHCAYSPFWSKGIFVYVCVCLYGVICTQRERVIYVIYAHTHAPTKPKPNMCSCRTRKTKKRRRERREKKHSRVRICCAHDVKHLPVSFFPFALESVCVFVCTFAVCYDVAHKHTVEMHRYHKHVFIHTHKTRWQCGEPLGTLPWGWTFHCRCVQFLCFGPEYGLRCISYTASITRRQHTMQSMCQPLENVHTDTAHSTGTSAPCNYALDALSMSAALLPPWPIVVNCQRPRQRQQQQDARNACSLLVSLEFELLRAKV